MGGDWRTHTGRVVSIGAAALSLGACASFDGMPVPVTSVTKAVDLANGKEYSPDAALAKARSNDTDEDKRAYRDAFIAAHIQAIDLSYQNFRVALSRQMKGANFGLELGILGLTAAGAVAASERAANILSSAASGLTGSRAALSKEVYFEKTLPALIASMDARRLDAKASILEKMRARNVREYTIYEAVIDLAALQQVASLDGAIEEVTAEAAADRAVAKARYEQVTEVCFAEDGVDAVWGRIRKGLLAIPVEDEAALDRVSAIVGTDAAPPFVEQRDLVITRIGERYCSVASATGLIGELTLKAGVTIP